MKTKSFTLIELLVVIVIIGILAGVITLSVTSNINKAQDLKVSNTLLSISKILKTDSLNSFPIEVVACNLKDSCSTLKAQLDLPSTTEDIYYKTSTSGKFFVLYANKPSNASLGFEITSIDENVKEVPSFDNLVAYYPLAAGTTNGATVSDMSPNSNNGTNYGASSTVGVDGDMGTAMSFDGVDDYISSFSDGNPIGTAENGFTISVWFYNKGAIGRHLVHNAYIQLRNTAFFIYTSSGYKSISFSPTNNVWHHLVGIFDGEYMKVYLDNVFLSQLQTTENIYNGSSLSFGSRASTPYEYFTGYIDDVRIYNRALSQEEINLLYNAK